jgi:leader peptidase (prepilin peptidase)/N-methyltransferase
LRGRSACDHCGSTLGPLELIPVLGRVLLRGHCRHCGVRIPLDETWIEIAAAAVGLLAVLLAPSSWPWMLACGWLLVLLAAVDHLHGILPDTLNALLFAAGLSALLADPGAPGAIDGLLASLAGAGAFALLAYGYEAVRGRSGLGGGDVKLMGALGVWTGLTGLAWIVLLAAAGALAGALVASGGRFEGARAIRFGPWLAGAGFLVALASRY